ncbi:MAG TPA: polysaccharide pyruvyl transferase family protein [Actinopolymorphaceae bacterium]
MSRWRRHRTWRIGSLFAGMFQRHPSAGRRPRRNHRVPALTGPREAARETATARDRTKCVGLVGFFGWGNYGDELFLRVWEEHLGATCKLTVLHDQLCKPYFTRPVKECVSEVDAILIGGGDLVVPWQISGLYWRQEYLDRPVYIAGVGVPTWGKTSPHVVERMREFFQHPNVRYISTRDPESAEWIRRHLEPKVDVSWAPDLVFAMTLPPVRPAPERHTLAIATRYRARGPDDFTQVRRLAEKALAMGWRVQNVVLGTGRVRALDLEVAKKFGVDGVEIVESEDLDVLTRTLGSATVAASMKFHGTVVATAYGVPCFALAPTDKSRNLFRLIDRTSMLVSLEDSTLADRLSPDLPPVPESVRDNLRSRTTLELTELRQRLLD